jgi:hypothetical protein
MFDGVDVPIVVQSKVSVRLENYDPSEILHFLAQKNCIVILLL